MASASGFVCPKCGDRTYQKIIGNDLVHILELQCGNCHFEFACETAHPATPTSRRFMKQSVRPNNEGGAGTYEQLPPPEGV